MFICLIRSIILYLLLILVIRLLGKRQLGEMEPSEFVVTMLIADLASVPMQDLGIPLLAGILPILIILILEVVLSVLSYHFVSFRKLLCGKPVILMKDGKIIHEQLKQTRITPDELTEHLREKDIFDLSSVRYAILETNGQISALLDSRDIPLTPRNIGISPSPSELPYTLITNGKILKENLKLSGHDQSWISKILKKHGCQATDVFLMTVNQSDQIYLSLKSEAK